MGATPTLLTSDTYDYGQEEDTAAIIGDSAEPEVPYRPYHPSHANSRISNGRWTRTESDFRPSAVSHTEALRLMQLMPRTAASLKVRDPVNPVENIRGGATHLRYLLNRFHGIFPWR